MASPPRFAHHGFWMLQEDSADSVPKMAEDADAIRNQAIFNFNSRRSLPRPGRMAFRELFSY